MTIRFLCPSGHRLSVPDGSAGTKVRCARCKRTATVPEHSEVTEKPGSAPPPLPAKEKPAKQGPAKEETAKKKPPQPPPAVSKPVPPLPKPHADSTPDSGPKALSAPGEPATRVPGREAKPHKKRPSRRPSRGKSPSPAPPQQVHESPAGKSPSTETRRTRRKRTARKRRRRQGPRLMPPDVYRPDAGRITTLKWLAFFLALAVILSVGPVFFVEGQLDLQQAQWWARLVVLLAVIQGVYILWMLGTPDWASVWVVMLVFAGVAALYGMATAIALVTWAHEEIPLGMEAVRHSAGGWCGSVLLVMSLATYLCGRTATRWRRAAELELAGRGEPKRQSP